MNQFKALLITRDEATKQQSVAETMLSPADLMEGDVDIAVEYSTVNYKDGLAITGKLPVVRRFPMIPGGRAHNEILLGPADETGDATKAGESTPEEGMVLV